MQSDMCTRAIEADVPSITSEATRRCPGPFYERLRYEAPVYLDPVAGCYVLSRYEDVAFVAKHPEMFSNQNDIMVGRQASPVADELRRRFVENGFPELHTLVTADPPYHTRNRAILDRIFTASFVKSFEPRIREICDDLIASFERRGSVDLYREFAIRLPMFIILDRLGLPREDWPRVKRWSDVALLRSDPALDPETELLLADEFIEMQNYLHGHMEVVRQAPDDSLLSLIANSIDADNVRLTDAEAVSLAFQVMVAGNETTTTVLMSTMKRLLDDDSLRKQVIETPDLISGVIEETLRLDTPIPSFYRTTLADVELSGVTIPKGSTVAISYFSANKDERQWQSPTVLDPKRAGIRNHFGFGRGAHYCIGHLLAKAELRIALIELLTRLPNVRLSPAHAEPAFLAHPFAYTLDGMHLTFDVGSDVTPAVAHAAP